MPRSNTTGGKHHKKGKKRPNGGNQSENGMVETAGANQIYACVKKKVGGTRISIDCSDQKERSGIIPGKFYKKVWMNIGDIVLCDLNIGADDSVCYIVHKYTPKEAHTLKSQGLITFEVEQENDDKSGYKFVEENTIKIAPQRNLKMIDDISDEDFSNSLDEAIDSNNNHKKTTNSDSNEEPGSDVDLDNL